ncbi:MAG: ABC transporter ATP-binding protein [Spirochaetia bacterium]|nr:ABC transporter ATP-binding protein [Spirochaetia bacterium]
MPIQCNQLSLSFKDLTVFNNFSLEIPDRHVTAVLGPSGCGKTTLLNLISGLLNPALGNVSGVGNERISYLFQEPRLLPWKSVRKNIELVLGPFMQPKEASLRCSKFLEMVGLSRFTDYYPHELSGGMRQRVAVARAFAYPAGVMLMDEPFQALDLHLKLSLIELFEKLWTHDRRTAVFVTHDIQEALLLGDTIVVLYGPPAEIQAAIPNPLPREQRSLKEHAILELEQQLYSLLA